MTWKNTWLLIAAFLLGATAGGLYERSAQPPETNTTMQIEYDSMRLCMQTAGKTGCRMTIPDFIRYYELQQRLDIPQ